MEHEGKVLLCRRGIEPALGKWTVPAGYMELSESTAGESASPDRCWAHFRACTPGRGERLPCRESARRCVGARGA